MNFINVLKQKIKALKQVKINFTSIKNFINDNQLKILIFISIIVILIIIPLLISLNKASNKYSKNKENQQSSEKIVFSDEISVPLEPIYSENFIYSREKKEKWNDDDVEKWFITPDDKMFEQIRNVNNQVSDKILKDVE